MVVGLNTRKQCVTQTSGGKLQAFLEAFQAGYDHTDMAAYDLRLVRGQMKLLIAEVDPHVEITKINIIQVLLIQKSFGMIIQSNLFGEKKQRKF